MQLTAAWSTAADLEGQDRRQLGRSEAKYCKTGEGYLVITNSWSFVPSLQCSSVTMLPFVHAI